MIESNTLQTSDASPALFLYLTLACLILALLLPLVGMFWDWGCVLMQGSSRRDERLNALLDGVSARE